jgi:predicted PurR-regulated permease PerM
MPILVTSVVDLANSIPMYINSILDYFDNAQEDSIWYSLNIADTMRESSGDIINQFINISTIEQFARGIINVAGEIFNLLLGMIISLYLLLERDRIIEFFRSLNESVFKKERVRNRLVKYLNQVNKVLFTFIASKGLDSIINLVAVTSILLIFDVPYAFLLGLIAGVFNFIPYLGSLIAVILITLITVITGGPAKAIQVVIPLLLFQQLDGNFIEPRIMKSSLKISPILVIIAVVIGGAYFGIFGMFFAVPVAAIIKQLLIEYVSHHSEAQENPEEGDAS